MARTSGSHAPRTFEKLGSNVVVFGGVRDIVEGTH